MKQIVKKIMPHRLYNALKYNPVRLSKKIKAWEAENRTYFENTKAAEKEIFLLNTPGHKNLGDLAIAEAEINFLNRSLPGKRIHEIGSLSNNIGSVNTLKKIIPQNAVILFHGGGYIGSDWSHEYEVFQRTVMLFPKNRIILLPQSVFYSGNRAGKAAHKRSSRDLSKHKDLHLMAREAISYELMKQYYPNANVYLVPDTVLVMEYTAEKADRKGILLCMRSDCERLLSDADVEYIENTCAEYGQIEYTDTFAPEEYRGPINAQTRKTLVDTKLEQFCRAELVVTDRLHGMVFAAITGTPCVALSNHNHKVKATAEWIRELGYIRYIDDVKTVSEAISTVLTHGPGNYKKDEFLPHYEIITKLISEKI